jgi:hypothetical protein
LSVGVGALALLSKSIVNFKRTRIYINTCRVLGKRGRGKRKEKTFNLFSKPNAELKMQKPSSIGIYIA